MDRKALREFTHKATHFLEPGNENYKQWVFRYTFLELEKDLAFGGDVTTRAIFPDGKIAKGRVAAGEDGVFGGREEIQYFLVDADSRFRPRIKGKFKLDFFFEDGKNFKEGDTLFEMEADIHDLLAVERTVLNLVMRMSGVATFTKKITDRVKDFDVLVTPTRKTLWGLLDKKAVVLGGGGTHRINLGDAIMVKDTHQDLIDRDFDTVFRKLESAGEDFRFVEIEVSDEKEALEVAQKADKAIKEKKLRVIVAILFDNMTPEQIKKTLDEIKEKSLYDGLLFEASGGITEKNVKEFAKTGVDIISIGSLTTSARSLDIKMKVEKRQSRDRL